VYSEPADTAQPGISRSDIIDGYVIHRADLFIRFNDLEIPFR
jgi:hypothetical protein